MRTYNYTHLARPTRPLTVGERIKQKLFGKRDPMLAAVAALGLAVAATYGYKGGYPSGTNTGVPYTPGSFNVGEVMLDFAKIALARTAAGQTALAANDVLQVFDIPAGVWVPVMFAQVLTVEGETATFEVGDGTDTDGFMAAVDANALGWGSSLATTAFSVAVGGGKLYTATDTLDIKLLTAAYNVGKVRLLAAMVDLTQYRSS